MERVSASLAAMLLRLLLLHSLQPAVSLLYAPPRGSIWDPSCIRVGGATHCVAMYVGPNQTLDNEHGGYPSGLLYSADQGC